ncbi:Putative F-box/LRR-repeat protein At3g18150 [Linum grandiflorum]
MTRNTNNSDSSRVQQGTTGGVGVDRISELPDSILHHILSFLDTKSAVQTSVLSKQWTSAWRHVHSLNLTLNSNRYSRYETFVDKVLSLRYPLQVSKVSWDTFAYSDSPDGWEFSLLRRLVQYAMSHGAQHFDIQLSKITETKPNISLLELFDSFCDNVRTLQLGRVYLDCQSECSAFRLLTMLKLHHCGFSVSGDVELVEPFSQFPCLKDLALFDCWWISEVEDFPRVRLRVSGLELVSLRLSHITAWNLEICAPKLESFRLDFEYYVTFSELTLPSLVHADIESQYWDFAFCEDYEFLKDNLLSMFHGLHNVESLTLFDNMIEAVVKISKSLEQQPSPFSKLKKLKLEFATAAIPYDVFRDYFLNGSSDVGLNIQTGTEGLSQVTMERLP